MRKIFFTLVPLLLGACHPAPQHTHCPLNQPVVTGTFETRTRHLGGGCGSIGTLELKLQGGVVLPDIDAGCSNVFTGWDKYSCATQSILECDDGVWKIHLDWAIGIPPGGGNKITGTLVAYMEKWYGWNCISEYSFEGQRVEGMFQEVLDKIKKF